MPPRQNISSGTKWEAVVGYSRAVRVGQVIEVAGTTAVDEQGNVVGAGDPYVQAKYCLAKIETGVSLKEGEHVVVGTSVIKDQGLVIVLTARRVN